MIKDIERVITNFVSKELLDIETLIDPEESFENLSLGSIEIMEIIFFIEKEFKLKLDAEVFREGRLRSVRSLGEFVLGKWKEP